MFVKILIVIVAAYVAFEILEHLVIPLLAKIFYREKRPLLGPEGMIGKTGRVMKWIGKAGKVEVGAEIWNAFSENSLSPGDRVVVEEVNGINLKVGRVRE